jgi:hypothetical protein
LRHPLLFPATKTDTALAVRAYHEMLILLSAVEADKIRDVLNRGFCSSDGSVEIDLPLFSSSQPAGQVGSALQCSADGSTVACRGCRARLTASQFALLRLLAIRPRIPAEEAQDAVWGREVNDKAVRNLCSRLSLCILDAGIPYSVSFRHGYVILEGAIGT